MINYGTVLHSFYLWIWTTGFHQWLDRLDEGKLSLSEEDVYTWELLPKKMGCTTVRPHDRPYKVLLLACTANCTTGTILAIT